MDYNVVKYQFKKLFDKKVNYQLGFLDYLIHILDSDLEYIEIECQEYIKHRKDNNKNYINSLKERDIDHIISIDFNMYQEYIIIELELKRKEIEDTLFE